MMATLMISSFFKWIYLITLITVMIFSMACFFLKSEPSLDMKSKFESGIDQNEQESPPFYMHFFYIGMLFLIFDVEVILSIPVIQSSMTSNSWHLFWIVFLAIIWLGLVVETNIDSMQWKE